MLHNILTWLLVLKVRTETHYFQHSPLDAQGTCLKDHPANGLHLVNISWGCVIFCGRRNAQYTLLGFYTKFAIPRG